ncbi:MAG TPA: DNA primase [Candidatus Nanopelagicaceae bacterium]|nr:DNA primase [Candidatus Nanopelagicaceae bacterium]
MTGRIRDEDVAHVREHAPIEEVIGDFVQLRNAGGGQKKGLCPFHDEKSPSFHVTPAKGYFHCFGCQEGGDVISFLMKIDHLSFTETVERLADRIGYELRYEEGSGSPRQPPGLRARLVEANRLASLFFQEQLAESASAQIGRDFLVARNFDIEMAKHFAVGYAPDEWDALTKHLRGKGFSVEELTVGGLGQEGQRGPIDRFRHRLMWPIKDISGDIVGFGARKLSTDNADTSPKYLNSPETPIYKKSSVLYGLELAKKEIARKRQVVVVEGYTDVMAAHAAGVMTAVATCGTAFGDDHIRILRRLLMDDDAFRGEVIFTFDGDAAGQKAALRAFADDQKFVSQTFVAVEPSGLDPCELRQQQGDAAVRDLVARRVPLFEFAIKSTLANYNLESAEGRVAALASAAPLVAQIRDRSLRPEYARLLAGWLGMEIEAVTGAIVRSNKHVAAPAVAARVDDGWRPDPSDPRLALEREVLKVAIQAPALLESFSEVESTAFTHPAYLAVRSAIDAVSGGYSASGDWIEAVLQNCGDEQIQALVRELAVEPVRANSVVDDRYAVSVSARLREMAASRTIAELKSRLQRINPVEQGQAYNEAFMELVQLEARRRDLHEQAIGDL